jgi:large subunit ribosomal protein L15e
MGAYKFINQIHRRKQSDVMRFLLRVRAWEYRQQSKFVRLNHPSRPEKAHRLGYKRKQGYLIYRVRIRRGCRKKPVRGGKTNGKPAGQGIFLKPHRNLQAIAESKVGIFCGGLRVLNSYWVNQDTTFKWYEVILVDPFHEVIRNDPRINWISKQKHKHRELRGKTSAGRKHRGLRVKGHGASKLRPSKHASWKRRNTYVFKRKR